MIHKPGSSPFGQMPNHRGTFTSGVMLCPNPKCRKPMTGLVVEEGPFSGVVLLSNVRCLHCDPLPSQSS